MKLKLKILPKIRILPLSDTYIQMRFFIFQRELVKLARRQNCTRAQNCTKTHLHRDSILHDSKKKTKILKKQKNK